jgi:putative peptidoglycan lipid II flippase
LDLRRIRRDPVAAAGAAEFPAPVGAHGAPDRSLFARVRSILVTALPSGAMVLSIVTFGGYAMGLLKDRMLGHIFGAGPELDAYIAAFRVPELALDVLVFGGLVAPFVPLFLGLRGEAEEQARAFARTILTLAIIVMAATAAILFVLAPQTVGLVAPGFTGDQRDLYVGLFRVMCITPVVFAASTVLGEILVAERRFLLYGLAPLMYSGGIVAGAFFLSGRMGIYGAAVGAVAGALAHLGIRLIGIYRTKFRPHPSLALRTKGLGEFGRLMLPTMASQLIMPLTFIYFTALASTLEPGSVTAVSYGSSFQALPVSLIGMSFAIAAFPAMSAAFAAGDRRGFARVFGINFATIGILSVGAALGMLLLGGFVIRTVLGGGQFDAEDVSRTTLVLAVFTVSIPLESLTNLMARALYATHNTLLPTIAAVAGFTATVLSAQALSHSLGLAVIPAAYSIGMGTRVVLLALALIPRMAGIGRVAPQRIAADPASPRRARSGRASRQTARLAFAGLAIAVLFGGTAYAANQALSVGTGSEVTPWARQRPPAIVAAASASATPLMSDSATSATGASGASGRPSPSPTIDRSYLFTIPTVPPTASPSPGPFSMDLYEKGDFVGEYKDVWCVPAAMQTSMNIMDAGADTTEATQQHLFDLAVSLGGSRNNAAEPEGWAMGLTKLGYGNYKVGAQPTLAAAVKLVVKQIRLTMRPAGLIVWYGWHSWVVSGFVATADPLVTDDYSVTSLWIEDVWYNRLSSIWGYSSPPDTSVPFKDLPIDYKIWHQGKIYPGKEGQFVYVIPTV